MKRTECTGKSSIVWLIVLCTSLTTQAQIQQRTTNTSTFFNKGKLLYKDNFNSGLEKWVAEIPSSPHSKVFIENKKLIIDVDGGATVWFRKKLSGNILIEYNRKVIMNMGRNDRLSDLNQFWMATDPRRHDLFTRKGVFSEYDSLLLYYVGFGGNTNTTTRFRKYNGKGERILHTDLTGNDHLLQPNKEYVIRIVVYNGTTRFFVDGQEFFSFTDPEPLREGYFGLRTTQSRQVIDNFRIYRIK